MKILMVNKFLYPRGGSESYMLKLGAYLASCGHEVEYFGMFDEKNTVGNSCALYTTNMDFHGTGAERFLYPLRILYSTEAKKKIGKVLDTFQPDVVHMNNINFQLTPSIIYAVKKRNIPLVQTVHDCQMICPNHLLYSFSEQKPCERCIHGSVWNCLKHSCIHGSKVKSLLGVIEAKLYRRLKTYRKVDLFISPSNFLAGKLIEANAFYRDKTCTIHNFIEKKTGTKKEMEPYILFVGRLSKEKGVDLLAETAKLLPECSFWVAGTGPDDAVLQDIPNVKLLGFLTGDTLTDTMTNAKVLLAPSVCYENCPLSILEAHSMGVPVVTMPYGGMKELVRDGETGTLAERADAESVAKAIRKTVGDEAYYSTLLSFLETEHENILSIESYCDILLEKYRSLTEGR
ncbi:MAG: glycosyltransferase family 4 protein [Clostridia bacterium]|nr:glycosyltransferase family 4 protein [Clostridia bacterium]